jgi:ABC-2 type transport system ATP-binding protein
MPKSNAIKVQNVSKTFILPQEKISTMKGWFVNIFRPKTYEVFKALDNVSFEVNKGDFFGVIGRNGSGKTTLLKIIAQIYRPDCGEVTISGQISPFLELGIGFHPELSGRDNIYLNGSVLGLTRKQIGETFHEIVAFAELQRFIDQKIKNYSTGMQLRLAFSVAIHANRDILLMDEVLAVGDANFQQKCLQQFNHYRDLGKTVILVTHDLDTVQRYCDRAMLLCNGKVEKIGKPEEVCQHYLYQNMIEQEKIISIERPIKHKQL